MARRKRLALGGQDFEALEQKGRGTAPIAHLAGDAAAEQGREIARLRVAASQAEHLKAAEAEGRVLADVALGQIDTSFLARDRILSPEEDEADRALRLSIEAHGQRVPIDLVAFDPAEERLLPYGLISGWRRLRALKALHRDTGEDRFATVRAIVRRSVELAPAFVAMVEENEVRAGLSFYERGRIAALAAEQGAYETPEAAIDALFAAGSAARRSKIRSFLSIYQELDGAMTWPETLSERLGLKLAQALKWGQGARILAGLRAGSAALETPEDEQALIGMLLAGKPRPARSAARGTRRGPDPARSAVLDIAPGLRLERRSYAGHTDFRLSGEAMDEEKLEAALAALKAALEP